MRGGAVGLVRVSGPSREACRRRANVCRRWLSRRTGAMTRTAALGPNSDNLPAAETTPFETDQAEDMIVLYLLPLTRRACFEVPQCETLCGLAHYPNSSGRIEMG